MLGENLSSLIGDPNGLRAKYKVLNYMSNFVVFRDL